MSTAPNYSTHQKLTALKHLVRGKEPELTAKAMNISRYEVIDMVSQHGYPSKEKMRAAIDTIGKEIAAQEMEQLPPAASIATASVRTPPTTSARSGTRPAPKPTSVAASPQALAKASSTPPAPASTSPAEVASRAEPCERTQPGATSADQILAAAEKSERRRTQRLAERVRADLDRLGMMVAEEQVKAEAERRAAAERARLVKEQQALEEKLAKVKAELRGSARKAQPTKRAGAPTCAESQTPAKVIRAWAMLEGIDVPAHGRVPNAVREAYESAHPGHDAAA